MTPETAAVEPPAKTVEEGGNTWVPVEELRSVIDRRSTGLNPKALALIFQPGATARQISRFDIEAEGWEPLFLYSLPDPDGRQLHEGFVGGFRLGLFDASTGAVVEETVW